MKRVKALPRAEAFLRGAPLICVLVFGGAAGWACDAAPSPSCPVPSAPGVAMLFLNNNVRPEFLRSRLIWFWRGFPALSKDFGTPNTTTALELCVYDYHAGTPSLRYQLSIPADHTCGGAPCWEPIKEGWTFLDPTGKPNGIKRVKFRGNDSGQGRIEVQGASPNLPPFGLPLVADPQVVVQLNSSTGLCWATHFHDASRNNHGQYMAKSF